MKTGIKMVPKSSKLWSSQVIKTRKATRYPWKDALGFLFHSKLTNLLSRRLFHALDIQLQVLSRLTVLLLMLIASVKSTKDLLQLGVHELYERDL